MGRKEDIRVQHQLDRQDSAIDKLKVSVGYQLDFGPFGPRYAAPDISVAEKIDALLEHFGLKIVREPSAVVVKKAGAKKA